MKMIKRQQVSASLFLLTVCCFLQTAVKAQITEPFARIHGGAFIGKPPAGSPDPLVNYRWSDLEKHDSLQYFVSRSKNVLYQTGKGSVTRAEALRITGDCDIRLDFGREYAAWPEFDCDDLNGGVLMSISEYNEPAILNKGAEHPVKTLKPTRYGNSYRLELNRELYEGVRFVWIHCRNVTRPFVIRDTRLICQAMPVNYEGSFQTNDPELDRIWYTGAYVVRLNILQDFFGAILMERSDRHSWTGDAYPAQAASMVAFGNFTSVRRNIEYTSRLDNGIASYAIYWVLSLVDYYNYTGDTVFLRRMLPIADHHLQQAFSHFDSLPDLAFNGWDERLGGGFERGNLPECQAVYRFLCLDAWKQFAGASRSIGEADKADQYLSYYTTKSAWMVQHRSGNAPYGTHAVSHAVNAGLIGDTLIAAAAGSAFSNRLSRLSYSPFNQYFILQAMAAAGRLDESLVTARDSWGGQIAYGGTSFFEVFRPSWNSILKPLDPPPNNQAGYTSLAHPWGAGITKWLSENILGIRPLTPGFSTVELIPYLGPGLTRVMGSVPTPHGTIRLAVNTVTGKASVHIPAGVRARRVKLPFSRSASYAMLRNGKPVNDPKTEADPAHLIFADLEPGDYEWTIDRGTMKDPRQSAPSPPPTPFGYAITKFSVDSISPGNAAKSYGSKGRYVAGVPGTPGLIQVPGFVDSLVLKLNGLKIWDSTAVPDARIPKLSGSTTGIAAAFITRDPLACLQTMTFDIHCKRDEPYKLSLYFLDWDKKDRRSAIEIFDLETLEILAPVQLIGHYEKGKYLSFNWNRSIRIRVNQVRGENVALSGVFFD